MQKLRLFISLFIGFALVVLIVITGVSTLNTDTWWIRFLDYPRLQIAAALAALIILYMVLAGWRGFVVTALALVALGYQVWTLWPYQPIASAMIAQTPRCADGGQFRIVTANVQRGNQDAAAVLAMARDLRPDVLLVLETNERWDRDLAPLQDDFAHVMQTIPENATYYGMHVYANHPFEGAEFLYPFDADTPLFAGNIVHPRGAVQVLGIHPRPPQMGQPSTLRDAAVLTAALMARDSAEVSIMAGDYNATPWNDTARLAMRVGQVLDPRAGRGPMVSFDAKSSWMKWPLDQILWQGGPGLLDFSVLPAVGSDHYPVKADLCLTTNAPGEPMPLRDGDLQAVEAAFDAARAMRP